MTPHPLHRHRQAYLESLEGWFDGTQTTEIFAALKALSQARHLPKPVRRTLRKVMDQLADQSPAHPSRDWLAILGRVDRLVMLSTQNNPLNREQVQALTHWLDQALIYQQRWGNHTPVVMPRAMDALTDIEPTLLETPKSAPEPHSTWVVDVGMTRHIGLPKSMVVGFEGLVSPESVKKVAPSASGSSLHLFTGFFFNEQPIPLVAFKDIEPSQYRRGLVACILKTPLGVPTQFAHFGLVAQMVSQTAVSQTKDAATLDWVAFTRMVDGLILAQQSP